MPARIGIAGFDERRAWHAACVAELRAEACEISMISDDRTTYDGADVVVAFDDHSVKRSIERGAREVWTFGFGRPEDAGAPVGFWALARGDGFLEAALVRAAAGSRATLKSGAFPTVTHSLDETEQIALLGAARWPAQVVRETACGCAPRATPAPSSSAEPRTPTRFARLSLALRLAWRATAARFGYLFSHEHWNVGIAPKPIESFADGGRTDDVRWFPQPARGSFLADPFGYVGGGAAYVFCEGFDYRDATGYLAAGALEGDAARMRPFLTLPVHLSYPCIVEAEGGVYCVPEMSQSGEIALFRARRLPDDWERVATLVTGFGGVDPTLVEHDGRWWMFCTSSEAPNHELHIFYGERIDGPWHGHPRNPVKIDVRSARPAGTPFVRDGVLHRPAQDCAGGYGRRVVINRVIALTPTEFEERPAAYVEPDARGQYPDGVHTLSAFGGRTLVDGKRHRFAPAAFAATLRSYARRLAGSGRS